MGQDISYLTSHIRNKSNTKKIHKLCIEAVTPTLVCLENKNQKFLWTLAIEGMACEMSSARILVHLAMSLAICYLTFGKSQKIKAQQQSARKSIEFEIFMYLQTSYVRIDDTKCTV